MTKFTVSDFSRLQTVSINMDTYHAMMTKFPVSELQYASKVSGNKHVTLWWQGFPVSELHYASKVSGNTEARHSVMATFSSLRTAACKQMRAREMQTVINRPQQTLDNPTCLGFESCSSHSSPKAPPGWRRVSCSSDPWERRQLWLHKGWQTGHWLTTDNPTQVSM